MTSNGDWSNPASAAVSSSSRAPEAYALQGFPPRFVDAVVEEHFLQSDYEAARRTRIGCFLLGVLVALLNPLSARTLLEASPELVPILILGGLLFQLPILLLLTWISFKGSLRLNTACNLQLGLVLAIATHAQAFRILCNLNGTPFPSSPTFIGICLCVLIFGLPLRRCAIALVLFFIAAKASELALMPMKSQDYGSLGFDAIFVLITLIGAVRADKGRREAYSKVALSERRTCVDALTGLANHWGFVKDAERIVRHAVREQQAITLAIVDADHFKAVNDSAGYVFGDFVLTRIGHCLQRQVRRPLDACARLGGEEFALLWHAPSEEFSYDIGRQIVSAVRALDLRIPEVDARAITVSVGLVTFVPRDEADLERLMRLAYQALYDAKQQGRDRSCAVRPRFGALDEVPVAAELMRGFGTQ